MLSLRNYDIKFVKGIGPERAKLLGSELGLHNAYDLLRHYPTSYIDRSRTYSVRSLHGATGEFPMLQLRGRFISFNVVGEGAAMRLIGLFSDGTATIDCVWFKGVREVRKRLATGREYVLFGKPSYFRETLQMTHPEVTRQKQSRPARAFVPYIRLPRSFGTAISAQSSSTDLSPPSSPICVLRYATHCPTAWCVRSA